MKYVPLHTHNHFSFLDGMGTPEQWVKRAADLEMPSLGISNHNNVVGYIKHYKACEAAGIKPLIGVEATLTDDIAEKNRNSLASNRDIVIYPRTNKQFVRLMRLMTKANLRGFYYKPRIDWQMLEIMKGALVTTACRRGVVNYSLLQGKKKKALKEYGQLCDVIGKRKVYLEVQPQDDFDQQTLNGLLVDFAKKNGGKLIVGTDSHYPNADDFEAHNILLLIQTRKTVEDISKTPDKVLQFKRGYHLMAPNEVFSGLRSVLSKGAALRAMGATLDASDRIRVAFNLGELRVPVYSDNSKKIFVRLIKERWDAFKKKLGSYDKDNYYLNPSAYRERLHKEMRVITKMGLQDFFLVMHDVVRHCLKTKMYIRARGSVAGSLVALLLNITDVDPLKFGLVFERFLNESRTGLHDIPDIDMDLQDDRREEAKDYLADKWGENRVVNVCTFGTMGTRSAIKDVARAYGVDYVEVNRVTREIGNDIVLKDAVRTYPPLAAFGKKYPKVLEIAGKLEGQARHISGHAAGVVITPKKYTNYFHAVLSSKRVLSSLDMDDLKELGLLKLDLLGSKVLHICAETEKLLKHKVSLQTVSLINKEVYRQFGEGRTVGVFQFGRWHFAKLCRRIEPKSINDLAIINALGRPGAKQTGQDEIYIRGRRRRKYNGNIRIPQLRTILGDTYGAIIFQEQVMNICHEIGGLTLAETNDIRENIKHFRHKKMRRWERKFKKHAIHVLRLPRSEVDRLWDDVKMHSSYSYNKSHSVCYSLLTYYTMYLKTLYPYEYMVSLMNNAHNKEELEMFVEECQAMKLRLEPPDVMKSGKLFTLQTNNNGKPCIVQGFVSIYGIGDKIAEKIIIGRKEKNYVQNMTPGLRRKLLEGGCLGVE